MRLLILSLIAFALLFQAGCFDAAKKAVQPEVLGLDRITLEEAGPEQVTLRARLRLSNPNPVELALDGLEFDLALTGEPIARGSAPGTIRLPASGSGDVEVRLTARYRDLSQSDVDALFEETIPYRIDGRASASEPVDLDQIAFTANGELTVPAEIEMDLDSRLQGLALVELPNASGIFSNAVKAATGVSFRVRNPLPIGLPLVSLDYRVDAGDDQLASGSLPEQVTLSPGGNTIELPVDAELGSGIERAAKSLVGAEAQKRLYATAVFGRDFRRLICRVSQRL